MSCPGSFLNSVDIGAHVPGPLVMEARETVEPDYSKDAFVSGNSVVSFVGNVDESIKADLLNSTLFAHLAATNKVGGTAYLASKITEYYAEYRRVLSGIGYVTQAFNFEHFESAETSFKMDVVVLEILAALLTEGEMAAAKATLEALEALEEGDGRITLFQKNSTHLNTGSFTLGIAGVDNGTPVLKIAAFHFKYDQNVTNVLFFTFDSSKIELYHGAQSMSLDLDVYSQVRAQIIEKLGYSSQELSGLPRR